MLHHLDEALPWIWLLINSRIISMRDKQGGVELIRADWTCFACELTRLPTGDQSIIATQVHKPSPVTHRTSRPAREHSFRPFCHLLAAAMNPSSCLPPTGFFATHQMALPVWGTFTLSGSMWLYFNPPPHCKPLHPLRVASWFGGWRWYFTAGSHHSYMWSWFKNMSFWLCSIRILNILKTFQSLCELWRLFTCYNVNQ